MAPEVRELLKRVSRSMYLSLAVLPEPVRDAMGLGYLFCRAADTIADTRLVPPSRRRETLEEFRDAFRSGASVRAPASLAAQQADPAERELLTRLGDCIELWKGFPDAERALLREVVEGVTDGMRMDLTAFPGDTAAALAALDDADQLDRYCAWIGGAPGLFWTRLCLLRLPELRDADAAALEERGLRLGKGLQITNILRDIPKDLAIGRCYLPARELKGQGLEPRALLDPASGPRLRPVLARWARWGLGHLEAGAFYVEAMPGLRLRAAVAWPLLLALKTLSGVYRSGELLRRDRAVKVSRRQVYRLLLGSPWTLSSNARFRRKFERWRAELVAALA